MKFTVIQWLATIVYDQTNDTILQILDFNNPVLTNYSMDDFLKSFDLALNIDFGLSFLNSTQYQNFEYLVIWFINDPGYDVNYIKQLQLHQFIVTSILVFNYQFLKSLGIPSFLPFTNLNKSDNLMEPRYQIEALKLKLTLGINLTGLILVLCHSCNSIHLLVYHDPSVFHVDGMTTKSHALL